MYKMYVNLLYTLIQTYRFNEPNLGGSKAL